MDIEYITRDDLQSHETAMQRVVEEKMRKREAIDVKRKRAIEAAQKAFNEAMNSAEDKADQELAASEKECEYQLAAMQRDFERLPLLRQIYHEAPNDVLELIMSNCGELDATGWGTGGLNAFRLANKRCKQVVESCATMIMHRQWEFGPGLLPVPVIQRCRRIEEILCRNHNLTSLEGCPSGLKRLFIDNASHLSDLSPLASCTMMESFEIINSSINDISVVASMPLLEHFACQKISDGPSIKDLSPLASCPRLKELWLHGNDKLNDLSPLSNCTALRDLEIANCSLITSLAPLSSLTSLKKLNCIGIHCQTSLLPLASCSGLEKLKCLPSAVALSELRIMMPQLAVYSHSYILYS